MQVPPQPAFFEQINYYRTACMSFVMPPAMLTAGSQAPNPFGSKDYARELVALSGQSAPPATLQ
jgi:antirestriction protein ArdC